MMVEYWMHEETGAICENEHRPSNRHYNCTRLMLDTKIRTLTVANSYLTNKLNTDSQNFQIECHKAEIARMKEELSFLRLENDKLYNELKTYKEALRQASRAFELLRLWNGQGYTYRPPQIQKVHEVVQEALKEATNA